MKNQHLRYGLFLLSMLTFAACMEESPSDDRNRSSNLIPLPNQIEEQKGAANVSKLYVEGKPFDDAVLQKTAEIFLEAARIYGIEVQQNSDKGKAIPVRFVLSGEVAGEEAYELSIQPDFIQLKASSNQGLFYASQTLLQLLGKASEQAFQLPATIIRDAPRFAYRGMHLDVCRHFFPVEFIKRYIDLLATYKLNRFHWHLTEDQGWRIEIKQYPKLNEIGSWRKETLVGHYRDEPHKFDGQRYGGYYTQEEVKEVVRYAQERFVTIIPEIEMPGHARAAIAAYPEFSCTGGPHEVATLWGIFDDVYCTREETFKFLENVLSEVIPLFPAEYVHIGGDECPKTRWKECARCQHRMKEEGLETEEQLQSYFIQRMEKYINSKGKRIIGWDEILEGGLAPDATVMSWRGISGGVEAARQGHDVVMTPTTYCYFDYYQSKDTTEPLAIGGYLPLDSVYSFEPVPKALSPEESKHILGVQGNVWTEYMKTPDHVEYMVLPRMQAIAEIGWTRLELKDIQDFKDRLQWHFGDWEKKGYRYRPLP